MICDRAFRDVIQTLCDLVCEVKSLVYFNKNLRLSTVQVKQMSRVLWPKYCGLSSHITLE